MLDRSQPVSALFCFREINLLSINDVIIESLSLLQGINRKLPSRMMPLTGLPNAGLIIFHYGSKLKTRLCRWHTKDIIKLSIPQL